MKNNPKLEKICKICKNCKNFHGIKYCDVLLCCCCLDLGDGSYAKYFATIKDNNCYRENPINTTLAYENPVIKNDYTINQKCPFYLEHIIK